MSDEAAPRSSKEFLGELWLRPFVGSAEMPEDKGPILGLAAKVMRQVLDVSPRTVAREWRFAKAWLFQRMGGDS